MGRICSSRGRRPHRTIENGSGYVPSNSSSSIDAIVVCEGYNQEPCWGSRRRECGVCSLQSRQQRRHRSNERAMGWWPVFDDFSENCMQIGCVEIFCDFRFLAKQNKLAARKCLESLEQ